MSFDTVSRWIGLSTLVVYVLQVEFESGETSFSVEKKMNKRGLARLRGRCGVLKACCWIVVEFFLKEDLIKSRLRERIRWNRLMGRYPLKQRLD